MARRRDSVDYDLQGVNEYASDCRCGEEIYSGLMLPWAALGSTENWNEESVTPQGLPDGDQPRYRQKFRSFEDFEYRTFGELEMEELDEPCSCSYCVKDIKGEELPEPDDDEEYRLKEGFDDEMQIELYDTLVPDLPRRLSPGIVSSGANSRKNNRSRKTAQCGKRGNNYYKLLRRQRVRVTFRKSVRVSRLVHDAFLYQVECRQRVVCH